MCLRRIAVAKSLSDHAQFALLELPQDTACVLRTRDACSMRLRPSINLRRGSARAGSTLVASTGSDILAHNLAVGATSQQMERRRPTRGIGFRAVNASESHVA
jgi:hypothetical protein